MVFFIFLEGHVFESIINLDIRVIIKDIMKSFEINIHHGSTVKELKFLVFHMKFKFQEKLATSLTKHSKCICKSMLLSENKKLKEIEIDSKDVIKVLKKIIILIYYVFTMRIGFFKVN